MKIEFKVWKTLKHPYFWTKPPVGGCIPEGRNPADAEIDVILLWAEDFLVGEPRHTWNLEKVARKGKILGLTFVPDFILKELGKLVVAEFGNNPPSSLAYAIANDFGQVFALSFREGGEFATVNTHGILCMQCGIPDRAPLIFVKPRKQEGQ